jgi:hypothetical protein
MLRIKIKSNNRKEHKVCTKVSKELKFVHFVFRFVSLVVKCVFYSMVIAKVFLFLPS